MRFSPKARASIAGPFVLALEAPRRAAPRALSRQRAGAVYGEARARGRAALAEKGHVATRVASTKSRPGELKLHPSNVTMLIGLFVAGRAIGNFPDR
jgi:hypothetical protein